MDGGWWELGVGAQKWVEKLIKGDGRSFPELWSAESCIFVSIRNDGPLKGGGREGAYKGGDLILRIKRRRGLKLQ